MCRQAGSTAEGAATHAHMPSQMPMRICTLHATQRQPQHKLPHMWSACTGSSQTAPSGIRQLGPWGMEQQPTNRPTTPPPQMHACICTLTAPPIPHRLNHYNVFVDHLTPSHHHDVPAAALPLVGARPQQDCPAIVGSTPQNSRPARPARATTFHPHRYWANLHRRSCLPSSFSVESTAQR
jgi:hypothetical protein